MENLQYDWFSTDDTVQILYNDGNTDYINSDYDGHKIRRQNIESIVYSNDSSYIVFGEIEINEYGVVYPAFTEKIAGTNVKEVDRADYTEANLQED